jgi:methylated-DNA-[protein]-cysteine S-methyltransferase
MTEIEQLIRQSIPRGSEQACQAAQAATRLTARLGAEGLVDVSYASIDSPFGPLLLAGTRKGLVKVAFPEQDTDEVLELLARQLSPRIVEKPATLDPARRELSEYFEGARRGFDLALDWSLISPFARRVLRATSKIPYGSFLTYGEVATQAGSPGGSRAAGNALGANPIPIVVPCHRVLRAGGLLGGYAGGPERKQWLLRLEGAALA